jgi:TRAP-type C4-dicarboxylate transport system permease small subunit
VAGFIRAVDRLSTACAVLAAVLLALAALAICWNVLHRALGASTYWQIEFAVYMMVAALFLGSPFCLRTHGHVAVDLLQQWLPPAGRRHLRTLIIFMGLAVCVYLTVAGGWLTLETFAKGERSGSTWAPPKWPLYLTLPVGLGLTALQYVADLLRERGLQHAASDEPGSEHAR